jgi:hypothetical protein
MRLIILSIISAGFLLQLSCTSQPLRVVRQDALKSIYIKSAQKWGYINDTGGLVIPPIYDGAGDFSDGLGLVRKGRSMYYINPKGEIALFDSTKSAFRQFSEGFAWVSVKLPNKKYDRDGFMNKKGQMITEFKYSWGEEFHEGISVARDYDSSTYFLDTTGHVVFATTDTVEGPFGNGLVRTYKNGKLGYLNKQGKLVIPYEYDKGYEFVDGRAHVIKNNLSGFIDTTGKIIVPLMYDDLLHFNCGRAAIKKDRKWGFINREGKLVIPMQYDRAYSFNEGYTFVSVERKCWFIDTNGNKIYDINPNYEYPAYRYSDGNVQADFGSKKILIMKYGKEIVLP